MKHFETTSCKESNTRFSRLLIIYFTLSLLIPSAILIFTEHYPVTRAVSALLIPAGFYLLWSVASRRNGSMVLWGLIWLILAAFQLVLLYMFGNSIIAVDMFTNLFTTNPSEAGELLNNILPMIGFVCVLYIPLLVIAVISLKRHCIIAPATRRRTAAAGAAMLLAGCSLMQFNVFPLNVLYNIYLSVDEFARVRRFPQTSADFRYDAVRTAEADNQREIYVLVIGEASRAASWQLYGYGRQTNPRLSREDATVYKNVVTQSNATHKSVPMILSSVSSDNHADIYRRRGIVGLYKDAGFKTLFVSCQAPNHGLIQMLSEESDSVVYIPREYDGNMLGYLRDAIAADTSDLFVVLHSYGSHFNYRERYPDSFSHFTPDDDVSISKSNKERMINAYDNSVLYTDWFLSEVISTLRDSGACSAMFYCADHGEDLFDDDRGRFLHSSPTITYYQAHVACISWFSDSYRALFPEKAEAAASNADAPASTHSVFHTVAQMGSIASPFVDESVSLLSGAFDRSAQRHYLDDHCTARPYGEMGLDHNDWQEFHKRGITDLK